MLLSDIIIKCAESLKKWVQVPVELELLAKGGTDSILKIGRLSEFVVEARREVHKANLPSLREQLSYDSGKGVVLMATSISKPAREVLRKENISYLDIAGNCLIQDDKGIYIQIEGLKSDYGGGKNKHTTFSKNGIKLIYAFFLDKELINQSYDTMAKVAKISKGTIGSILRDLKERQFLFQVTPKTRTLNNKQALFERWTQAYNEKLRPSLFRGRFNWLPKRQLEWKAIAVDKAVYWGGEPAAELITNYLMPAQWTIYTTKSRMDLIKEMHLVPAPNSGNVYIYDIFWDTNTADEYKMKLGVVHPMIAYSDLINTMNDRNFEAAKKLYEQELSTYFVG
ncbi:MAG: type IV toxin-antitoxin system AbiEi family antitoxin [Bacteroidota bacterium]